MYLHYTPRLLHWLYPKLLWHMPRSSRQLFLTFDDGPIPEVTPRVLEILEKWNAKATFFCVGDNVGKHPEVFRQLVDSGHRIGNHTQHHLRGTTCSQKDYLENVALCQQALRQHGLPQQELSGTLTAAEQRPLFRPPYGRFTQKQRQQLQKQYRLVMWDVLSADFDKNISPQRCLQKSIYHSRPGSIIVFHDSVKAWDRLQWVLPRYLQHFSDLGYTFSSL